MTRYPRLLLALALPLALPLALGACKKSAHQDLDGLDRELTDANGAGKDPAVMAALRQQITVDPALAQSSNARAVRPASRPDPHAMPPEQLGAPADSAASAGSRAAPAASGACPGCKVARQAVTLGALAERGGSGGVGSVAACASDVRYSSNWALRLPPALPLYPDARVSEAAGKDGGGCALRVVSFASNASLGRVLNWYYDHATRSGYSAAHQADGAEHVLTGARGEAGYVVYLSPRDGGGTSVDLVTNGG